MPKFLKGRSRRFSTSCVSDLNHEVGRFFHPCLQVSVLPPPVFTACPCTGRLSRLTADVSHARAFFAVFVCQEVQLDEAAVKDPHGTLVTLLASRAGHVGGAVHTYRYRYHTRRKGQGCQPNEAKNACRSGRRFQTWELLKSAAICGAGLLTVSIVLSHRSFTTRLTLVGNKKKTRGITVAGLQLSFLQPLATLFKVN